MHADAYNSVSCTLNVLLIMYCMHADAYEMSCALNSENPQIGEPRYKVVCTYTAVQGGTWTYLVCTWYVLGVYWYTREKTNL